jgi:two-component system, OmpR family, sensor histidine kinase MprB
MSFRRRMVLLAAGAVATSVLLASVIIYVTTRDELLGQIDASLRQKLTPGEPQAIQIKVPRASAARLARLRKEGTLPLPAALAQFGIGPPPGGIRVIKGRLGGPGVAREDKYFLWRGGPLEGRAVTVHTAGPAPRGSARAIGARLVLPAQGPGVAPGYAQLFQANGRVLRSQGPGFALPVTAATRAVAAGQRGAFFSDATLGGGTQMRILTEPAPHHGVWQVALPLAEVDSTLSHLKLVLAIVSLGGIALAAALGLVVSRAALVPIRRLTGAAERVARTQDLGHRIEAGADDELGRLAASFNTMLAALERSQLGQRQLVSDASHELRTPLTSVGANLDALAMGERLDPSERARVVAAAQAQLRELGVLVGDLVDLSKTEVDEIEVEDVRLDLAAAGAIERARLHAPRCRFHLDAEPCLVRAAPARLDRAIANLLDNAVKWGPPAGPVEVHVRAGRLEVRDRGPGLAAEDLPRVFDRFYRAPTARSRPGSGLGLAIVRQVAETHGGTVHAANDPGGGARLTLELPPLAMSAAELAASQPEADIEPPPSQ